MITHSVWIREYDKRWLPWGTPEITSNSLDVTLWNRAHLVNNTYFFENPKFPVSSEAIYDLPCQTFY